MVRVLGKSNATLAGSIDKLRCEIIDSDKARRATLALQNHPNVMVHEDYQNSSPPRCQSETDMSCDSDGDSLSSCYGGQINSPMDERHAEVIQRRKERRRERNKLSAQAYRMRKREEIQNQDKVVIDLEEEQKRLQEKVAELEQEKTCVEKFLRNCFHSVPWPVPINVSNNHCNKNYNTTNWHVDRKQTHCDQANGNVTFASCATISQGQNMMTVNNQMVVS